MKKILKLKAHQDADKRNKFGKKVLRIIPELKPYVRHRLFIANSLEIIPKNMYRSTGIIDDAIITLFESDISMLTSTIELRLYLFKLVKEKLDAIFKQEAWHQKSVSTDKLLHQELNKLRTRYTIDADGDFVMNEDLNDISYQQKKFTPQLFLSDESKESVLTAFDIDQLDERRRKVFKNLYSVLSLEASNIVDLYIFGKLNTTEIAQIKNTDELTVREIILQVKDRIQKVMQQPID